MKTANLLKRDRVNIELSCLYEYPLTIVEAPMGYGKTTAVKSFFRSEKLNPLWLSFHNSGDPGTTFFNSFAEELSKYNEEAGSFLNSLELPADVPQLETVLAVLNEIELKEKMIVVIDDYHLSHDEHLNRLILAISAEEVSNLHFLIITRDTIEFDFVELLSKKLCRILSRQHLKFTDTEIRCYCKMMSEGLSDSDLKKIIEYTDGWISFIYLILLGLQQGIQIGMNSTVEELIEKTLFNIYDQRTQDFLLKLSLMDEFTAAQAEFVTEEAQTKNMLKKLSKGNAFVFYDEVYKSYKIHNVLLDFLRNTQKFQDIQLAGLYERIGDYFLSIQNFQEAYRCFYKAGQNERILACSDNPKNIQGEHTQFEGSVEMFNSMPRDILLEYPLAYLQYIWDSLVYERKDPGIGWSERLNELLQYYKDKNDLDIIYRKRIIAETLIVQQFTFFNDLEKMVATNLEILELLNGQQSYITLRGSSFTFGSPHYIYLYYRDPGSLDKIAKILSENVGYAKFSNGCGTGADSLAEAEYALETGDFNHVEFNSIRAIFDAEIQSQTTVIICAKFNLIRYRIFEGKVSEALDMLNQLEQDIEGRKHPVFNTTVDICKGYIYACLGQPERIPFWLQTGDMTTAALYFPGIAFNYVVYGKALLALKKYSELEILSESFKRNFVIYNNQLGLVHNNILEAVAKYHVRGAQAGTEILEKVLLQAQSDRLIMPFAEYAPHILGMMKTITAKYPQNEYLGTVFQYCRQYERHTKNTRGSKVTLSPREKEVLLLTAKGFSRKEIADSLFISDGTVKTHLKNIYQKLEVSGKVTAVKVAQAQGLIEI